MQKFQDLLTEAAQLKQQQLKQQRKNFEALPQYLKSGLNYAKKYVQLRKQHYQVQKYISQNLKKQGNDHYLLENYGQALSKYQQALSVFRFIHATKYENLKDQDIMYQNYTPQPQFKEQHNFLLVALYLNICSALTKMNKKDEAIHSSEQALKLNPDNPKIYYKKAQAYLQYINRQSSDIKVGFYYLNKAYQLSKDQSILTQMHKIKKQLDQERQKQKQWFKFMFDKNKQAKPQSQGEINDSKQNILPVQNNPEFKEPIKSKIIQKSQNQRNQIKKSVLNSDVQDFLDQVKVSQNISQSSVPQISQQKQPINSRKAESDMKARRMKQQLDNFRQENENNNEQKVISQVEKLQKTKITLKPYLIIPRDDRWLIKYQQDFIHKHGSKIYSILQLYNYSQYLVEFKSLLAKCLQLKQAKISAQRDENKLLDQKIQMYQKFIQWMKNHPVQKYKRYIQRYQLQTKWIKQNRGKPLDEVFIKQTKQSSIPQRKKKTIYQQKSQQRLNQFLQSVRQTNNKVQNNNNYQSRKQKQQTTKQNIKKKQNQQNFFVQEMLEKQQQIRRKTQNKKQNTTKNQTKKHNTYGFKQQWQCSDDDPLPPQSKGDQVPSHLKGFLQNYQDFPMYQQKLKQMKKQKQQKQFIKRPQQKQQSYPGSMQQDLQNVKQNPFGFVKTFLIILGITLLVKIIF